DMSFQPDALNATLNFSEYTGQSPYSETFFENSPLNRPHKKGAPGNDWQGNATDDNDHTIKFEYLLNDRDEVRFFDAKTTWNAAAGLYDIQLIDHGNYERNTLIKTITKDENWTGGNKNTTEEFKDKLGRVVLKRTYHDDPLDTYYVYDLYGNLTYVIPPMADNPTQQLDEFCYQYKYDYRNRVVEKKIPGKQWEFLLYDRLDRVVATGPAFTPFGGTEMGWIITKYDAFGRVAYTGWFKTSASRST
ncbi:DUF6443 domain-containing protein, partial [Flavobacterium sp. '19STA2R22 D10 B1']|uniref:DUF6443 domain-containing protein n=1 Tax=Flavobacterium aerium TaxID=3037261 RepID=UPI00278C58D9